MDLEERVRNIEERNTRVEADKAWETSGVRAVMLIILTYGVAALALYAIGNDHPLRNAIIPALGFFLSIQTLPFVKAWWVAAYLKKK